MTWQFRIPYHHFSANRSSRAPRSPVYRPAGLRLLIKVDDLLRDRSFPLMICAIDHGTRPSGMKRGRLVFPRSPSSLLRSVSRGMYLPCLDSGVSLSALPIGL